MTTPDVTGEEILRELGIDEETLVLDVGKGTVESMSDAIAARVHARLAAEGLTIAEMAEWTDETHPAPNHDADERAREEYAKKHGIDLGR